MRYYIFSPLSLLFFLISNEVYSQNLDKILEKHFEEIGQENFIGMRSILLEAKEVNGFTVGKEYNIIKKLPNKIRIEGKWQEKEYIKAYDGKRAWTLAPWTGVNIPQLMTEREKDLLLMQSMIGSPLYAVKDSAYSVILLGAETMLKEHFHVIRLTSPSGFYVDYLLNKRTHLIHLARVYKEEDTTVLETEIFFKNYKNLGGQKIPFGFERRTGKYTYDVIIENIVIGHGVSSSVFKMPPPLEGN